MKKHMELRLVRQLSVANRNVLAFADLLEAVGESASALDLVQRLYDTRPANERTSGHFGVVIDALANDYNRANRFDDATKLFLEAVEIYDPATAEEQHLAALNNLALVYNKQGRTSDALGIYERVRAFAEKSGQASSLGIAIHNIAMMRPRILAIDQGPTSYAVGKRQHAATSSFRRQGHS